MQTSQSRHKRYTNVRQRNLEFVVGDKVFSKVAHMKGVLRFARKGKLNLCFFGPFEILERIALVAYRLALASSLSANPSHIVDYEPLQLNDKLSYEEKPIQILAREVKTLHNER